jgi:hypothetical protein
MNEYGGRGDPWILSIAALCVNYQITKDDIKQYARPYSQNYHI